MTSRLLLCTDLDRTLLPNGNGEESPQARPRFKTLARRPEVTLAYVSGRDRSLIQQAIDEYGLPRPHWVVGDVGTTLYGIDEAGSWTLVDEWQALIGEAWGSATPDSLAAMFKDLSALTLQEDGKQNRYKLSYYAPDDLDSAPLLAEMAARLKAAGVGAELIWSIDETSRTGLLDVITLNASKKNAVDFLIHRLQTPLNNVVYAGDSGNDLAVFASAIPSVVVANSTPQLKQEAQRQAAQNDVSDTLYLAQGGFLGMNGNYAAGILEGAAHYLPETLAWIEPEETRP